MGGVYRDAAPSITPDGIMEYIADEDRGAQAIVGISTNGRRGVTADAAPEEYRIDKERVEKS